MIWLLIGYMWLFVHRPFEIWPVLATYRIERVYMVVTIFYWIAQGPTIPAANRSHQWFAAFVLGLLASWALSPYASSGQPVVENYLKYVVFYVLLVTSARTRSDLLLVVAGYVVVMGLFMSHSLNEYRNGYATWAQGLKRMMAVGNTFDFNDFGGLIVCSLPLAWVVWREARFWCYRMAVAAYCALAAYCVFMTGSRMGMVGLVLATLMGCLASKRRWLLLATFPVMLAVAWMALPEGNKDRYLTLLDSSHVSKGGTSGGNYRLSGFTSGLTLLEQQPLLGSGPNSMREIYGHMPHNLYGQLLGELGLVGTLAFVMILISIALNAIDAVKIVQHSMHEDNVDTLAFHTVVASGVSILLLAIMAWGFNFLFWHVWLWFGGFQVVALQLLKRQTEERQWLEECDDATDYEMHPAACV